MDINFELYKPQVGSGLSGFEGMRYQRGAGLGNIFKKFYSWILPIFKTHALPAIKSGAKTIGKEAIKSVANFANDAFEGQDIESSIKNRTNEAFSSIANDVKKQILEQQQTDSGLKRKKKTATLKRPNNCKARKFDIFD